jgi:hypothetical protein
MDYPSSLNRRQCENIMRFVIERVSKKSSRQRNLALIRINECEKQKTYPSPPMAQVRNLRRLQRAIRPAGENRKSSSAGSPVRTEAHTKA